MAATTQATTSGADQSPDAESYFVEYDAGGVLAGFLLPAHRRAEIEKRIGRQVDERIWNLHLTGRHLLVALDSADEKYGALYLPRSSVERQQLQMGAGWVIAAGPLAGTDDNSLKKGVLAAAPSALLGRHVYFESYTGKAFRTSKEDDEFNSLYVVMTSNDVFAVDRET